MIYYNQEERNVTESITKKNFTGYMLVSFNKVKDKETFLESLKQLWQYEIESGHTVTILIKNLSYDYRKEALGCALKTPELKNPVFLMNIFCLIKGYNTFEDIVLIDEEQTENKIELVSYDDYVVQKEEQYKTQLLQKIYRVKLFKESK